MNEMLTLLNYALLAAAVVGVALLVVGFVDLRRRRVAILTRQKGAERAVTFISNAADRILSAPSAWSKTLDEVAARLHDIVRLTAYSDQQRSEADIAHDTICSIQLAIQRNLNSPNELALEQLLSGNSLIWNLSRTPADLVSVKYGGWYERARLLVHAGGIVCYFQEGRQNVDQICSSLRADQRGGRIPDHIIIDPDDPRSSIVWIRCSDELLLIPEGVIWNPFSAKRRVLINTGPTIRVKSGDSVEERRFDIPGTKPPYVIADASAELASLRFERARLFYDEFVDNMKDKSVFVSRVEQARLDAGIVGDKLGEVVLSALGSTAIESKYGPH